MKYKINGRKIEATSIADAIHQVKDGPSFGATRITVNSAADISLSKIVQVIKKSIEDFQDKVIKIANGKVYDYAKQAYMEMEFQVYMHDAFKRRDTWGSIPIDFRLDYSTVDKLLKESDYALEKTMSEIKKKLKSYENKTIYEDKTYSMDSVNDGGYVGKYLQAYVNHENKAIKLGSLGMPNFDSSSFEKTKKYLEGWIKQVENDLKEIDGYLKKGYEYSTKAYDALESKDVEDLATVDKTFLLSLTRKIITNISSDNFTTAQTQAKELERYINNIRYADSVDDSVNDYEDLRPVAERINSLLEKNFGSTLNEATFNNGVIIVSATSDGAARKMKKFLEDKFWQYYYGKIHMGEFAISNYPLD